MTKEDLILKELQSIKLAVSQLVNTKKYVKITEAVKILHIPAARLRLMCKNRILPWILYNEGKKLHFHIDIVKAKEILENGGIIPGLLKKYQSKVR